LSRGSSVFWETVVADAMTSGREKMSTVCPPPSADHTDCISLEPILCLHPGRICLRSPSQVSTA
jgi:hypothetical protein